jgi:hypothetical protein
MVEMVEDGYYRCNTNSHGKKTGYYALPTDKYVSTFYDVNLKTPVIK